MTFRTAFGAGIHLFVTYTAALPWIVYRTFLSPMIDPKGTQAFLHQVLNAVDLESDDPVLGSDDIQDLLGTGEGGIQIVGPYYSRRESDTRILLELACLGYLMQNLHPKLVFEIGTFVGRTTRLFAVNSPQDCQIVTLDLPQLSVAHDVGVDFRNAFEATRIYQLFGDSLTFDFSPWFGKCDFVWVDACHDYKYVLNDAKIVFKLIKNGGWIGFHDYRHTAWWSGVTRVVQEINDKLPGNIVHIMGTTIALGQFNSSASDSMLCISTGKVH